MIRQRFLFLVFAVFLLCPSAFAAGALETLNGKWRVDASATMALGPTPLEDETELDLARVQLESIMMEIIVPRKRIHTTMGGGLTSLSFTVVTEDAAKVVLKLGEAPETTFEIKDDNTFILSDGSGPESSLVFKRMPLEPPKPAP